MRSLFGIFTPLGTVLLPLFPTGGTICQHFSLLSLLGKTTAFLAVKLLFPDGGFEVQGKRGRT